VTTEFVLGFMFDPTQGVQDRQGDEDVSTPEITWKTYEKLGVEVYRALEMRDNTIVESEVVRKDNPPKVGEELFVPALTGGLCRMKVTSVIGNQASLRGVNWGGVLDFFPEDNEWRCMGLCNLAAIQKLELKP
jgi:hypothetical protein